MNKTEKENVHEGHRNRLKETFSKTQFEGFSDHQILEMILFYAYARIDTNTMAHNLINKFGDLCAVFDAPLGDLVEIGGLTKNAAVLIKLIPFTMRRYHDNAFEKQRPTYENTSKLCDYFKHCFPGEPFECFYIATFDDSLHLMSNSLICKGGPSSTSVNLRKIADVILKSNTSLVAISHNHPTGSSYPSDKDVFTTNYIINFLKSFGVRLLDHIVVGRDGASSMRQLGLLVE